MTSRITIATDGGCYPNPGPWGWGWAAEDGSWGCGPGGEANPGTNNRAELTALEQALLHHPDRPLHILYDSQYAVNSVTKWVHSWIAKGTTDRPNFRQIARIAELLKNRPALADVTWEWVRGHTGHPLNERADTLASLMVKQQHHPEVLLGYTPPEQKINLTQDIGQTAPESQASGPLVIQDREVTPELAQYVPKLNIRPRLIGFGGYKESGKDAAAGALAALGYQVDSVARSIDEAARIFNPIIELRGGLPVRYCDYVDDTCGGDYVLAKENPEVRRILLQVGALGRSIQPGVWTQRAQERLAEALADQDCNGYVLTGVRFPNEMAMVREHGGLLVWVSRPGYDNVPTGSSDVTETSVGPLDFDTLILNDGSLEELHQKVLRLRQ